MDWLQDAAAAAAEQSPIQSRPIPPVQPGRVLHFDGDLLAYWAGGSEDTTVEQSRTRASGRVEAMRELAGAESVVMHMTADSSTKADRRIIATVKAYQAQRKAGRKPKNWGYLREWLTGQQRWRVKEWATREADDGISLCAHDACRKGQPLIAIGSGDKDMRMLPGIHVNWQTFDVTEVPYGTYDLVGADGKQYGYKWFFLQMLQGDTADNIPGLPMYNGKKVGEVTAVKLLADCLDVDTAWQRVLECYEDYYGGDAVPMFTEQAMLLWLRTDHAAASSDFANVLQPNGPTGKGWLAAINDIDQRIKAAYAEAQSYGSSSLPQDRA